MLKTLVKKLKARLPTRTPIGLHAFHAYCDELFELYGIPDKESYRQAIANMLIHRVAFHKVTMHSIACAIRKAQCDEVCYAFVDQIIKKKKDALNMVKAQTDIQ